MRKTTTLILAVTALSADLPGGATVRAQQLPASAARPAPQPQPRPTGNGKRPSYDDPMTGDACSRDGVD